MQQSPPDDSRPARPTPASELRDAFRDLHGSRLHGFALLLTLGDRHLAARLAASALAAGAARAGDLTHPERAAAWLRHHVLQAVGRRSRSGPQRAERRAALEALHVDAVAFEALAALGPRERAAVIAATVERLDLRDVATILDLDTGRLERLLRRARTRASAAGSGAIGEAGAADGPIATMIRSIAARAMT